MQFNKLKIQGVSTEIWKKMYAESNSAHVYLYLFKSYAMGVKNKTTLREISIAVDLGPVSVRKSLKHLRDIKVLDFYTDQVQQQNVGICIKLIDFEKEVHDEQSLRELC